MEKLIEEFITLFVIIDPIGLVPIFLSLSGNLEGRALRMTAVKSVIIAMIVLAAFAFAGDLLLNTLGISEPAFRIAGGILLFILSIDMVIARHSGISSTTSDERDEALIREDISVFPIAIPLIAGPGALVTIILFTHTPGDTVALRFGLYGIILVIMIITLACLLLARPISRMLGITGTNVISRIFGIILAALAVQYIMDGIRSGILNGL